MTEAQDFESLIHRAEIVVSRYLDSPVRLSFNARVTEEWRRSLVLRCNVEGASSGLPATLIVKHTDMSGYNPDDPNSHSAQALFNDWAGVEFLNRLADTRDLSPRFYGGNREAGFFVMEDLGPPQSLVQPLLEGQAQDAEQALVRYAIYLGQMHAATSGRQAEYDQIRSALGPLPLGDRSARASVTGSFIQAQLAALQETLSGLQITLSPECLSEIEQVIQEMDAPGLFQAYTHGDPCPDNCLYTGTRLVLFDFERGAYRYALQDGVYGRIMFPTCWCANRVPASVLRRMEESYQNTLAQGCEAARNNEAYTGAILYACAFWTLTTLATLLANSLEQDRDWGISTARQRILARLEAFVETATEFNGLPAIQADMLRILEAFRTRWRDVEPLPYYPAFR